MALDVDANTQPLVNTEDHDERLVKAVLNQTHKSAYEQHVTNATRNLSVEVHSAIERQKRSRIYSRNAAIVVSALLVAVAAFVLWPGSPLPTPNSDVTTTHTMHGESVHSEMELESAVLDELLEDAALDHVAMSTPTTTIVVTSHDVELLLEGM